MTRPDEVADECERLSTKIKPLFERIAGRYVDDEHTLMSVVNEVQFKFIKSCRDTHAIFKTSAEAFGTVIARGTAIDELRKKKSEQRHGLVFSPPEALTNVPDERRQPQMLDDFREACDALPDRYRRLVALKLEGMTHDQIAIELGISVDSVGKRLKEAKAILKQKLGGDS